MKYFVSLIFFFPFLLQAQEMQPIRDNSFLVEEAFNQEAGVVQHIFLLRLDDEFRPDLFLFTQEWPLFSDRHQFSYSLPLRGLSSRSGAAYLENLILNYRFQLLNDEKIFFAPRLTAILPVHNKVISSSSSGIEINLPFSIPLNKFWIMHVNAGGNYLMKKMKGADYEAHTNTSFSGLSFIYQPSNTFNVMNEFLYTVESTSYANAASSAAVFAWNPGFRAAINFKSGLQIVPGFSVPFQFYNHMTNAGFLFYLSFEHSLTKAK